MPLPSREDLTIFPLGILDFVLASELEVTISSLEARSYKAQ